MCYSANDSLIAYKINLIISLIIFNYSIDNHIKVLSLFFLFVGQMQLFDYIFWKNQKYNNINKITTKIAILFNHLQPIILILLQYIYKFKLSLISIIVIIIYSILSIIYTFNAFLNCFSII